MSFTNIQFEAAVSAMMEGATPEQVARAQSIPLANLKKWSKKYCVKEWLEVPVLGKLLRSGLFHVTSRECLRGIVQNNQIPPFTSTQFKDWKFTDPTIAEELKSVPLFAFHSVSASTAAARILAFASQNNHHSPAVLLSIDGARLSQPLIAWTPQLQKEHPYRNSLANVETWHPGPIAWEAVSGCWTWSKQGHVQGSGWSPRGGVELLQNFSHLLGNPDELVKALISLHLVARTR